MRYKEQKGHWPLMKSKAEPSAGDTPSAEGEDLLGKPSGGYSDLETGRPEAGKIEATEKIREV